LLAEVTVPGRGTVGAAVEGGVGAQIAANLDAGVGAGDVKEARAVKRADPDIFYRLGLDRKVGRFCAPPNVNRIVVEARMMLLVEHTAYSPKPRYRLTIDWRLASDSHNTASCI